MNPSYTIALEHVTSVEMRDVGAKSWHLGRLRESGLRVPRGLVIRTKVYDEISAKAPLAMHIQKALRKPNPKAFADTAAGFLAAELPAGLQAEISAWMRHEALQDSPLVVRSSADAEDGPRGSYAGVYESFLNVRKKNGVTKAILDCYASGWSSRACAYLARNGNNGRLPRMAILITPLIDARASGVAFTCDPKTGNRSQVVIAANFGLGESVVRGLVEPDEYVVDTSTLHVSHVVTRIGSKRHYTGVMPRSGTALVPTIGGSDRSVLTSKEVLNLAILARRVEALLGDGQEPQDIEWAIDSKGVVLLQARPVTGLRSVPREFPCPRPIVWSNVNLRDSYPGVQSTLGWDILDPLFDKVFYAPLRTAGVRIPEGLIQQKLFEGRPYLNWSALISLFEAVGADAVEVADTVGGQHPIFAGDIPVEAESQRMRRVSIRGRLGLLRRSWVAARHLRRDRPAIWADVNSELTREFAELTDEALLSAAETAWARLVDTARTGQLVNALAGGASTFLIRRLRRLGAAQPQELASALCAGVSHAAGAELGYRIRALALLAGEESKLAGTLRSQPLNVGGILRCKGEFSGAFESVLRDYGHRAVYEMELAHPRWDEDPSYLLEAVRALIDTDGCLDVPEHRHGRKELRGLLRKSPWEIISTKFLISAARRGGAQRENARSVLAKRVQPLRHIILEFGRRLGDRQILDAQEDVFTCSWWDLVALVQTDWAGNGLSTIVEQRKVRREQRLGVNLPDVIVESHDHTDLSSSESLHNVPSNGLVLKGVGVCPGRARGRAAKLASPLDGGPLGRDFVLVAPTADPGWTPLLMRARGIVMEMGGFLSHGAIIAREFGIPTVVNVAGAMSSIGSGEPLLVDGTHGFVEREAASELPNRPRQGRVRSPSARIPFRVRKNA